MNPIMGNALRHLNVIIGQHIGISPMTKKVKPKGSSVTNYLLLCNHFLSVINFSVLTKKNKKILIGVEGKYPNHER